MPPRFLVLSEDGSHDAVPSLAALTTEMFQILMPGIKVHLLKDTFEPPEARLRRSLTANKWKSRSAQDQFLRTELVRYIATHLLRPNGFVIFHFDGDTSYRDRTSSPSTVQFARQIVAPVSQLVRKPPQQPARTDEEVEQIVQKLIRYVPYYCVEAWMYYNLPVLEGICRARVGAKNEPVLATWSADPAEIEEAEKPWSLVAAGKDHNRALAEQAYPANVAFDTRKSFHDTVVGLLENQQLVAALQELT
jgi:hypothetical protein